MKGFLKKVAAKIGRNCNESEPAMHGGRGNEGEQPKMAADGDKGGGKTTACRKVGTEAAIDGCDGNTGKEERVKGLYQVCPLSSYNGGRCIFAWWYTGTLHCFYGNGDTIVERKAKGGVVVEQPNVMCPKRAMWLEAKKRKLEKLKWEEAMRTLAEAEYEGKQPKMAADGNTGGTERG